ncbi:translation initiation factor IF-2 [Flavitalea sp. BT771]|uniref:translation initiation factor IF-2 n=1 Tax=Flavitalea sp. BT771 TaxID=3063329 RepID=UPI0026E14A24|nr:translation initiation factor IF-2 [Flavitalea sp. BT771]MDO6433545.1 translation initiation factor IF-2 [Flavitalea sp. BT771]MDV6222550.1 translation initiation factor IF-2 [Flavitalea sp. BT771]
MAETPTLRLMAAAKEFNIGKDTLVEFLAGKGFSRDDLKPTSKLTEDMYRSLQQEFQSDKVAKIKSDQIDLPKGSLEAKKKKEEETVLFKKEIVKKPAKEETPVLAEPVVVVPPVVEEKQEEPVRQKPVATPEAEIVEIEAPRLEGPKVVDKIDLSNIDSSTRPKKPAKKTGGENGVESSREEIEEVTPPAAVIVEKEAPKEKEIVETSPEEAPHETPEMVEKAPVEIVQAPEATPAQATASEEPDVPPVIENIKAEKLEGPKILGKIDLPVNSDTRPKPPSEEKRKRKRIPIEKKDSGGGGGRPPHGGGNQGGGGGRPPQQGGGGNQRPPGQARIPIQRNPGGGRGGSQGGGGNRRPDPRHTPREVKEIDKKEIQEKIRQTQAKLAGAGGRGKSLKAKYRRAKRDEMAEQAGGDEMMDSRLQVTEFISVSELANLMDVSYAEVIGKCMSLGMMVSINQRLEADVIELVAGEFGYTVEFIGIDDAAEMEEEEEEDDPESMLPRSPVVTIMGHVDHGKTSLLDYIRSANVVAGEAGGITQHIGAYQVTTATGKKITFLDTPGHEAFTAMRARGAKAADVAVIVVAADDAVMPQTKEAISHAQAAGLPMIFAINKIDKDGANPEKIKEQLAGMNILVEDWGGKFQSQEISAKKGLNVDLLLEKIGLEAELLDLKANPDREAMGSVIEASLDKGRGYVATVLVQNGTLRNGDLVVSGQYFGRVKAMFNERNKRVEDAPPTTPVLLLGLNGAPQAGEKFKVYADESEAKEVANKRAQILREQGIRTKKHITLDEIGRRLALGNFKELNLIIKGDVDGSVEALSDSLQKLSTEEIAVRVVHKAVGAITESDVLLATASDAVIVGFNVRPSSQASRLAENEGVEIKTYSIIYNAIEEVKSAMEGMLEPKIQEKVVANVEVRNVFKFDKATVAGCYVLEGKIYRNAKVRLVRDGIVIYPTGEGATAELASLKRFKDDVKEVASSMECGLTIKNYSDVRVGDIVEAYEEEEVKRTL